MNAVYTEGAPQAIGPYSQAIVTEKYIFTSGQIPLDPTTGLVAGDTITAQAKQAIENLAAILAAAGAGLENVVKTTCYLKNLGDFAAFNAVYETYFVSKPARSCIEVSALPKDALVEIEAIAEK